MALIKKVIQIELLYDNKFTRDTNIMTLTDIDYEMTEGDMSGVTKEISHKELTKKQMAKELLKQGSDPSFLGCEEKE
jgi:hypothetical protein